MIYLQTPDDKLHKIETKQEWLSFNHVVKRMIFPVNDKQNIIMEGFEKYLRRFEYVQGLFSANKCTTKIYLEGKFGVQVMKITIDLINKHIGKEISQSSDCSLVFWKTGIKGIPRVYIKD